jgi:mRNA-degrading endonuclease toxin of MazEF toxin-antitoxin module
MADQLTVDLDAPTRAWLRRCARRTGRSDSAAAAAQLQELALRDAVDAVAAWSAANPTYIEQSEEETILALAEAG